MNKDTIFQIKDYAKIAEFVKMIEHLSKHFGNLENILVNEHGDYPIDIAVFGPNEKSPYWKLVTIGTSDYAMKVPEQIVENNRIELVMYLPIDWQLDKNELNSWPINTLIETAQYPREYDTFLGFGHTVEFENPFPNKCQFQSVGLVEALDEDFKTFEYTINNKNIHFLQLFPMCRDEIHYKKKYGMRKYLEKAIKYDKRLVMDYRHKSVLLKERDRNMRFMIN